MSTMPNFPDRHAIPTPRAGSSGGRRYDRTVPRPPLRGSFGLPREHVTFHCVVLTLPLITHHSSLPISIQLEFGEAQHLMHEASDFLVHSCVVRRVGGLVAMVVGSQVFAQIRDDLIVKNQWP